MLSHHTGPPYYIWYTKTHTAQPAQRPISQFNILAKKYLHKSYAHVHARASFDTILSLILRSSYILYLYLYIQFVRIFLKRIYFGSITSHICVV